MADMVRAIFASTPRRRVAVLVAVLALHVAAVALLVRAFAPDLAASVTASALQAVNLRLPEPEPRPIRPRQSSPAPRRAEAALAGADGSAGRKADPQQISAPPPLVVLTERKAAPASGTGAQVASGAQDLGMGSGSRGEGNGTGAGTGGNGTGGGGGMSPPIKIAGEINSARDYARAGRALRLNSRVVIALTVGVDGRVSACRVLIQSPDPNAGETTCRLASERFRFRPANDAAGNPIVATYGWQQRWFN